MIVWDLCARWGAALGPPGIVGLEMVLMSIGRGLGGCFERTLRSWLDRVGLTNGAGRPIVFPRDVTLTLFLRPSEEKKPPPDFALAGEPTLLPDRDPMLRAEAAAPIKDGYGSDGGAFAVAASKLGRPKRSVAV